MQSYFVAFYILSMKMADLVLIYLPPMAKQPLFGQGPPLSRRLDHTRITTLCRIALAKWSAERVPDNTQHSQETDIHTLRGIRTRSFN